MAAAGRTFAGRTFAGYTPTGTPRIRYGSGLPIPTFTPTVLAGSGARGYVDGAAGIAEFDTPLGMDISLDGSTLYVCDVGAGAVRAVDTATGAVSTLILRSFPLFVTVGPITGDLYVTWNPNGAACGGTSSLERFTSAGVSLGVIYTQDSIRGIGIDATETFAYVASARASCVWAFGALDKVTITTGLNNTISGSGSFTGAGGAAVDIEGGIFWCQTDFGNLYRVDPSGTTLGLGFSNVTSLDIKNIRGTGWIAFVPGDHSSLPQLADLTGVPATAGNFGSFAPLSLAGAPPTGIISSVCGNSAATLYLVTSSLQSHQTSSPTQYDDVGTIAGSYQVWKLTAPTMRWRTGAVVIC